MGHFKDLKAWQHARKLARLQATREECAKTVYGLLSKLPDGPKQPGR